MKMGFLVFMFTVKARATGSVLILACIKVHHLPAENRPIRWMWRKARRRQGQHKLISTN